MHMPHLFFHSFTCDHITTLNVTYTSNEKKNEERAHAAYLNLLDHLDEDIHMKNMVKD